MKKNERKNNILINKWVYILFSLAFMLLSIYAFSWGHDIKIRNSKYILDNALLGTFGDFVGGVLGTIFSIVSVLLLIRTFIDQRIVTDDNKKQTKTEQFNNLFFELLHLYQSEVNELCGQIEKINNIRKIKNDSFEVTKSDIQYNNKDFFDEEKIYLQLKYRNVKSYEKNRMRSLEYYMLFFIKNRSKISAYFRTLFRIYELIDQSQLITNEQRVEYAKIIRAQLTDSELFFLRYNSMTTYGKPFINYINKYNIMKHLPAFELLEFKDWWKDMNGIEKEGVNIIYYLIRKSLCYLKNNIPTQKRSINLVSNENYKYNIEIVIQGSYDFTILIIIKNDKEIKNQVFMGLRKLSNKQIQQLIDCFIKELFVYSNYESFNNNDELKTYSEPIKYIDNKVYINSGIQNVNKKPLIVNYQDFLVRKNIH